MKKYISFEMDVLYFQNLDVITTSGGEGGGSGPVITVDPNEGWDNGLLGGENDNEW